MLQLKLFNTFSAQVFATLDITAQLVKSSAILLHSCALPDITVYREVQHQRLVQMELFQMWAVTRNCPIVMTVHLAITAMVLDSLWRLLCVMLVFTVQPGSLFQRLLITFVREGSSVPWEVLIRWYVQEVSLLFFVTKSYTSESKLVQVSYFVMKVMSFSEVFLWFADSMAKFWSILLLKMGSVDFRRPLIQTDC